MKAKMTRISIIQRKSMIVSLISQKGTYSAHTDMNTYQIIGTILDEY